MAKQQKAIINIGKALMGVSLPTLAAMGGATGNVWLAGLAALPAVVLASSETWKAALQSLQSRKESLLELPPPQWWPSDIRSWQGVGAEIEQALPSLLQEIERQLKGFQEVVTVERVQQLFIEALAAHPLTWAPHEEERRRIGAEIAASILTKLEQVLNPLVERKQRETALSDLHTTSTAASKMLSLLEQMYQEVNKPKKGPDPERLKERYFAWLAERYEYMDLGGLAPQVASKAEIRVINIRMEDIFIPLQARSINSPWIGGQDLVAPKLVWEWAHIEQQAGYFTKGLLQYLKREVADPEAKDVDIRIELPTEAEWETAASGSLTLEMKNREEIKQGPSTVVPASLWSTIREGLFKPKRITRHGIVILGDPGTGKSTSARYLAYNIAKGKINQIGGIAGPYIPVIVKAAEYGRFLKTDRSLSFYRYITGKLYTDEYGPLFQKALEDNRCLMIIDGLDEVPDSVLRMRVTEKIEQFVSEYHQNFFIITSRIVGYQENPLTGNFLHFQLMEWQPKQIITYLERWYLAVESRKSLDAEAACKQRAQDLWKEIEKNEGVKDLAGTPLLLAIIALINYYGGKLPERRVEFYQLASETLLSNWPLKQREQRFDARELLAILEPIAHRIFTTSPDRLITEYEFRPLFEEQVRYARGISLRRTRSMSSQLLEQIEQHTGFFLSRGTNEHGQQVYGFLHPTFAEYLTARFLANQWLKTRQLAIVSSLHEATWHEVVLLLAGHLGMMSDVLTTQLIEYIDQIRSPYEDYLHRDLLLIVEMLGERVC